MRSLMLGLTALTVIGYMTYHYGADSSSLAHQRVNPMTRSVVPKPPASMSQASANERLPSRPAHDRHPSAASRLRRQSVASQAKTVPFATFDAKNRFEVTGEKRRTQSEELAALGLRSAAEGRGLKSRASRDESRPNSKNRIVAKRWVRSISGPNVRLTQAAQGPRLACSAKNDLDCDRRRPKDANVAGVVVNTERIASHPRQPMEGQIKGGHYLEVTPAVYVK